MFGARKLAKQHCKGVQNTKLFRVHILLALSSWRAAPAYLLRSKQNKLLNKKSQMRHHIWLFIRLCNQSPEA
jgi:hypothetical protein